VVVDERSTKSADRCDVHPGSPSVAMCDGCGRPMCLVCATPVRGRTLGVECLAEAIGPGLASAATPPEEPARFAWLLIGAAFGVAMIATLLPWTRFGEGSGPFGAWGRAAQWSLVAAIGAAFGLIVWLLMSRARTQPLLLWLVVEAALGAAVALGSVLAAVRPPPFTRPWLGPWIGAPAGLLASAAAVRTVVLVRHWFAARV
jgi:hypothetical protein